MTAPNPRHTGRAMTMREVREALGHRVEDSALNPPGRTSALPDILRGAADRIDAEDLPQTAEDTADFHDGARWATAQLRAVAGEVDAGPTGDATPDWLVDLARRFASVALTGSERAMLRYALDLVDDRIASEGDEFTDEDQDAAASLRSLATGPVVAYRNPYRPGVLLCREHGEGWAGLTPLTSDDLPDGGVCTHGDPADPNDVCGRDVLIPWPTEAAEPDYRLTLSQALDLGTGASWDAIRDRVAELHQAANGSQHPARPCHRAQRGREVHPVHTYRVQGAESYWCPGLAEDERRSDG